MHIGTGLRLKNYTLGGSFLAYAANGFTPELVASFENEFYGYDSAPSTFDDMMTVSTTSLETMVDSDGKLKWNAHNLIGYSEQFDNAVWTKDNPTVSANDAVAPDGTMTADTLTFTSTLGRVFQGFPYDAKVGYKFTFAVWVRSDTATTFPIGINGQVNGAVNEASVNQAISSEWTLIKKEYTMTATDGTGLFVIFGYTDAGDTVDLGDYEMWGAHVYRSDLGGMVNNPDSGNTYVPTAGSGVYLPRRNGHLYDASVAKWNAHNYLTYSNTFDNAVWDFNTSTGTATSGEADPNGGTDAWLLQDDSGGASTNRLRHNLATLLTAGVEYTFEIVVKAGTSNWCFFLFNGTSGNAGTYFNLDTGAKGTDVITIAGATTAITDIGGGFYLLSINASPSDVTAANIGIEVTSADNVSTADVGDNIIIYAARTYRSDLNGVVANGDDGTYVATTTTAVEPTLNTAVSFPKKGLRLESAAATNLHLQSNTFTGSEWTVTGLTATAAQAVGADGEASLTKMEIPSTANESKIMYNTTPFTVTADTTHCTSVDVRDEDQRYVKIVNYGSPIRWSAIVVDLNTGTITQSSTASGSGTIVFSDVEDLGDGLYRIHLASKHDGTSFYSFVGFASSGTPTLAGDSNESYVGVTGVGLYVGAVQTVLGSSPSSYIPTNGATATRAAETISIAGAKTPANTTAMSILFKGLATYADEGYAASPSAGGGQFIPVLWKTNSSEYIEIVCVSSSANTGALGARQETASVFDEVYNLIDQLTPGINQAVNVASRNTSGAINLAKDGTASTANTTPTALTDLSAQAIKLGPTSIDGGTYNGFISELVVWGADIGDTGIEEAST